MALAQYTDTFWFPTGTLAANIEARVFPENSNAFAALFADAGGTVPLANPTATNGAGVLTFWAESGDYWVHLDSETFPIAVGMSQEQAGLSTGTASGGEFVASATPMSVDIAPLVGYVVSQSLDGSAPTITRVVSPQRTETLTGASLTRVLTWWIMDAASVVTQQATRPTNAQRRTHLLLGLTAFDSGSGTIVFDQTLPVILPQPANQMVDLMEALGPFNVSGNRLSAVPGTLGFDKTEGRIFAHAFNHFAGPVQTNDPHISTLVAQAPVAFQYVTQGTFSEGPPVSLIDPTSYDVGGVITPIGGLGSDVTIQRIWGYPLNDQTQQVRVQYGQILFASISAALEAVGNVTFIPNPEAEPFSALLGYIIVRADATDLSDQAQARIIRAGKFDAP
jgi:hypothetical protein